MWRPEVWVSGKVSDAHGGSSLGHGRPGCSTSPTENRRGLRILSSERRRSSPLAFTHSENKTHLPSLTRQVLKTVKLPSSNVFFWQLTNLFLPPSSSGVHLWILCPYRFLSPTSLPPTLQRFIAEEQWMLSSAWIVSATDRTTKTGVWGTQAEPCGHH